MSKKHGKEKLDDSLPKNTKLATDDIELARQMEIGREIMRRNHEVLKALAKK
ncbi:hypothetical protein [Kordiimonas pumila]|uniref:Transcriptional regulator n=1 Tax=Kordiimonas pumila TaxID=2161677 RepID=A0ABV7D513_9PROT|nr:hypothetical protein [Kordiimonas pumila]